RDRPRGLRVERGRARRSARRDRRRSKDVCDVQHVRRAPSWRRCRARRRRRDDRRGRLRDRRDPDGRAEMSRVASRLLLVVAGVAFALVLVATVELVLRATGRGVVRELHEIATPTGPLLTRYANWEGLARNPALSLDRVACAIAKPAGTLRVVVVDESTVAGFPFAPQFSFSRVVEA